MQDYEKLGLFYLGKEFSLDQQQSSDDYVLYKSKQLTTHAVIIGMTGSGKTGLGIGLLEEAAIDNIPVIVIDPKGDMVNMALAFPELRGEDFEPWVNEAEARNKGFGVAEYAEQQAQQWRKGLESHGQGPDRIARYRKAVDMTVYTPGANIGVPVSIIRSFTAPPQAILEDPDALAERVSATTESILSLIGSEQSSITGRDHILIANILQHYWLRNLDLTLEDLIRAIRTPPFAEIGVMALEEFFPEKDRMQLVLKLNALLASPDFQAWLQGVPLDIQNMLYTEDGKPRISIFSIAHLGDRERMFFVTMLLNEMITWMRSQSGTGSLRALLYMDEVMGYLPPVAQPPSKKPFITLLKQARAYGLGLILATQNPIDLDYQALSNAGTWFIGRLQAERDKERVLAGLAGVNTEHGFDRAKIDKILSSLTQRVFYLHSVYDNTPTIFQTRWVLSYLAGPLTANQIKALPARVLEYEKVEEGQLRRPTFFGTGEATTQKPAVETLNQASETSVVSIPAVEAGVKQVYLPYEVGMNMYSPYLLGVADVSFRNKRYGVDHTVRQLITVPLHDGPLVPDWQEALVRDYLPESLTDNPPEELPYEDLPQAATKARSYPSWQTAFRKHLHGTQELSLWHAVAVGECSEPGESKRDFIVRIKHLLHEERDREMDEMRSRYDKKLADASEKIRKANQQIAGKNELVGHKRFEAVVATAVAVLGMVTSEKKLTPTNISKVGTALRSFNRAGEKAGEVPAADENLQVLEQQLTQLEQDMERDLNAIRDKYSDDNAQIEEIFLKPTYNDININLLALAWGR